MGEDPIKKLMPHPVLIGAEMEVVLSEEGDVLINLSGYSKDSMVASLAMLKSHII